MDFLQFCANNPQFCRSYCNVKNNVLFCRQEEVNNMENPQHFECDTPDCCYWSEDGCTKGTAITIQEHHCVDYEEQPKPGSLTVTIEVQGGLVKLG